jgi:hypothetical protein
MNGRRACRRYGHRSARGPSPDQRAIKEERPTEGRALQNVRSVSCRLERGYVDQPVSLSTDASSCTLPDRRDP